MTEIQLKLASPLLQLLEALVMYGNVSRAQATAQGLFKAHEFVWKAYSGVVIDVERFVHVVTGKFDHISSREFDELLTDVVNKIRELYPNDSIDFRCETNTYRLEADDDGYELWLWLEEGNPSYFATK